MSVVGKHEVPASTEPAVQTNQLKRELKVTDAAAFSMSLIGPVGAMALLGAGAAGLLGAGATWAFVFAIGGVSLVAYGFIKLSQYIAHTGSVYALVGSTLGPKAGFVAGWALLGGYLAIGAGSTIEIALFFNRFLHGIHLVGANTTAWIWTALIAMVLIIALSFREMKFVAKVLLISEIVGVALVSLLSIVILVRTGLSHGPQGQTLTWSFLKLPHGSGVGTIAGAAVFGFLAFAGFEGAAALGEETVNPKKQIPRAIKLALAIVAAFFLLTIVAQSIGYGTSPAEVLKFSSSAGPYGDLGTAYVGAWLAVLLNLVASISLFAITIGDLSAGARILLALSRDGGAPQILTRVSKRGTPTTTIVLAAAVMVCTMIGQRIAGTGVVNATFYWLTIGTISLLVAYAFATTGALRFLFLKHPRKAPAWQISIPILALGFVGYTIYKNVVGVVGPYRFFPYIVLGWLLVAVCLLALIPGLSQRLGRGLSDPNSTVDEAKDPS
jgi:amino acid transporter